ncbi:hypothetical protein OPT61_g3775 [Boeremia exigua]|uniref:Uncharacterized protein n=1 Tax=Boeremia exigua TaxID=749465 RepID=A0ACC2IGP9_9PLEO|nr:hypothetical protein OPT61_g3775 [Boeremia exigua]
MTIGKELQNPIIRGFAPDPSVCAVGEYFFLVNSSFHIWPGLPIYASKNLQDWTLIGHAINRSEQLSLSGAKTGVSLLPDGHTLVGTTGLLAATIRHYHGRFYVVCTNASNQDDGFRTDNFYVTTEDIWSNNWSEPVYFDFDGIDTSLFVDDDNRAYVQGACYFDIGKQPSSTIKQFEVDLATGKALSPTREIWPGYANIDTEGPHIYKRDGYYYLLVAEGGTFEHHMLSIARSTDIWGPYESYQHNPIVTADGTDEYIQNTGHGELFEDQNGSWWAAVLAIRHVGDGRYTLGRETFLTPVSWPSGGWPKVEQPKMKYTVRRAPEGSAIPPRHSSPQSLIDYRFIRTPQLSNYHLDQSTSTISVTPSIGTLESQGPTISFLGLYQPDLDATASVALGTGFSGKAGLALYKDAKRSATIAFNPLTTSVEYAVVNAGTSLRDNLTVQLKSTPASIEFRIIASERSYTFEFRTEKRGKWASIAELDTLKITSRDFTGPIFGVFATADSPEEARPAIFREFVVY